MAMIIKLTLQITDEMAGQRLDQTLAQAFTDYSRARIQQWIRQGDVCVDGEPMMRPRQAVKTDQQIDIQTEIKESTEAQAQPIELDIVYQDNEVLVINKPAGLVVHPGAGNPDQTLMNALLYLDPNLAQLPRAGILHRLDKNTTGLLMIARTLPAYTHLSAAMQERNIHREYVALVTGMLIAGGTIEERIGRHPTKRTRMAVLARNGKSAITHYRIAKKYPAHTLLHVQLETGRTHQIRVHMAHIHHPIVGDPVYGGRIKIPPNCTDETREALRHFPRQALHAAKLTFTHPGNGQEISVHAPMPADFEALLRFLD